MIRHTVLFKVRPEIDIEQFQLLMQEIAQLRTAHSGFMGFEHGPNQTPETRDQGYTYGFILTLGSWADLAAYQNDPNHQATGAKLLDACLPDHAGLLVFDMEVGDIS
jgi:hypothetical protein